MGRGSLGAQEGKGGCGGGVGRARGRGPRVGQWGSGAGVGERGSVRERWAGQRSTVDGTEGLGEGRGLAEPPERRRDEDN